MDQNYVPLNVWYYDTSSLGAIGLRGKTLIFHRCSACVATSVCRASAFLTVLALAHPHVPQKLHQPGTRERHVGRPHPQLRGELRGEEHGAGIGAGCVVDANSAA